jgi:hypothetical protein
MLPGTELEILRDEFNRTWGDAGSSPQCTQVLMKILKPLMFAGYQRFDSVEVQQRRGVDLAYASIGESLEVTHF